MSRIPIRHAHLFCGLGGGARGFNRAQARVGQLSAEMQCIGGIDNDPAAIEDFNRLAGVRGTVLDLFSREQYIAFHGKEPPAGWREATSADVHAAFNFLRPNILFTSPPCQGNSGLLAESKSGAADYQAQNELALRGIWLTLEAYAHDPIEFILLENVPRIAQRSGHLLDQIEQLVQHYGYACARTTHCCGEIGGLPQRRKRFLMVARHMEKVKPFLYEPARRPLRSVGDALGRLPLPGDPAAGPLHCLPNLQWQTWVRLAFVEAGKDWRSLNRLRVDGGQLVDYGITPLQGADCDAADPRFDAKGYDCGQYGVHKWGDTAGTIINVKSPGQGTFSVADPRSHGAFGGAGKYRVTRYEESAGCVIAANTTGQGAFALADPRMNWNAAAHASKLRLTPWAGSANAITGARGIYSGAVAVADPRPGFKRNRGDAYLTAGHYGVVKWGSFSNAVTGSLQHDNGFGNVADPRLPTPKQHLRCVIIAEDNTYHRPFTTLDMSVLQTLLDPEEHMHFQLHGESDEAKRKRIGNAVPPDAAQAIASVMARTLLLGWTGETSIVETMPVWVRPIIAAIQCGQGAMQ